MEMGGKGGGWIGVLGLSPWVAVGRPQGAPGRGVWGPWGSCLGSQRLPEEHWGCWAWSLELLQGSGSRGALGRFVVLWATFGIPGIWGGGGRGPWGLPIPRELGCEGPQKTPH